MNGTGNVSGVDLNSLCPTSQNPTTEERGQTSHPGTVGRLTRFKVRCKSLVHRESIVHCFSNIVPDATCHIEEQGALTLLAESEQFLVRREARNLQSIVEQGILIHMEGGQVNGVALSKPEPKDTWVREDL